MKRFRNFITTLKLKNIFFVIIVAICCLTVNLIDRSFWDNLVESIKTTLESAKPTEELFDDTSGVKLVSVLFKENSCLVSTEPIDYDLQLTDYENFINDSGIITVIGAKGILYAPFKGEIEITELVDNFTQITIKHSEDLCTVFSGKFGLGIKNGDNVRKGQPLALMLSDMQFYLKQGDEIIDNFNSSGDEKWND